MAISKSTITQLGLVMSDNDVGNRNDCWNKNVLSRWWMVEMDGDDCTWTGKVFIFAFSLHMIFSLLNCPLTRCLRHCKSSRTQFIERS